MWINVAAAPAAESQIGTGNPPIWHVCVYVYLCIYISLYIYIYIYISISIYNLHITWVGGGLKLHWQRPEHCGSSNRQIWVQLHVWINVAAAPAAESQIGTGSQPIWYVYVYVYIKIYIYISISISISIYIYYRGWVCLTWVDNIQNTAALQTGRFNYKSVCGLSLRLLRRRNPNLERATNRCDMYMYMCICINIYIYIYIYLYIYIYYMGWGVVVKLDWQHPETQRLFKPADLSTHVCVN